MVVGIDHTSIATDERDEGDGLRSRESEVAAGPVKAVAVPVHAAELPAGSIGHLAFEDRLEDVRIDGAGKAERFGALAGPGAGFPVGGIVPGVVAVALIVSDALRRRGDGPDRDDHQIQSTE